MFRISNEDSAARRSRWLGELAEALDDARRLLKEFGAEEGRIDTVKLNARIEAVRLEVQAIRLRRSCSGRQDIDPEWTKDIPWQRSA